MIPLLISSAWALLLLLVAAHMRGHPIVLGTLAIAQRWSESPKGAGREAGALGWLGWRLAPGLVARRQERRRLRLLEADLPETVDLLSLAVSAGCNVNLAVAAAGRRGVGPLAAELRRVSREVDWGRRLADALDDLPERAGQATRPLAAALAACERYGTPLVPALQRLSDDVRLQRRRRAEESARRVPVTLLFPLVLCILPAFALLTVAPLVAGAVGELGL